MKSAFKGGRQTKSIRPSDWRIANIAYLHGPKMVEGLRLNPGLTWLRRLEFAGFEGAGDEDRRAIPSV
jgi:hypothetical protein